MEKFCKKSEKSLSGRLKYNRMNNNRRGTKSVNLHFQVHHPYLLKRYRFFDIGNEHYYYDDHYNESLIYRLSEKCYMPANQLLLELITKLKGKFKVSFSISGLSLEQFEIYAPDVLHSFQELAQTGCVEFVAETWSHSLSSLYNAEEFNKQVKSHENKILDLFGKKPTVFRNTEMIYSDQIGEQIAELGYKTILTEGARHILGWKSPNFVYVNALNPRVKILMRNFKLCDDISFRFSSTNWTEYPLTAEKFIFWLEKINENEEIVNLFLDYETFGERQSAKTGIFAFLYSLANKVALHSQIKFSTPSDIATEIQPVSAVSVPQPISWTDDERDINAWTGNSMQKEALLKLYSLSSKMGKCHDSGLMKDWQYLQCSDHFWFMSTKYNSGSSNPDIPNPFDSPYEAFINYMNVLSDFRLRLDKIVNNNNDYDYISDLQFQLLEKEEKIRMLENRLKKIEKKGKK